MKEVIPIGFFTIAWGLICLFAIPWITMFVVILLPIVHIY